MIGANLNGITEQEVEEGIKANGTMEAIKIIGVEKKKVLRIDGEMGEEAINGEEGAAVAMIINLAIEESHLNNGRVAEVMLGTKEEVMIITPCDKINGAMKLTPPTINRPGKTLKREMAAELVVTIMDSRTGTEEGQHVLQINGAAQMMAGPGMEMMRQRAAARDSISKIMLNFGKIQRARSRVVIGM